MNDILHVVEIESFSHDGQHTVTYRVAGAEVLRRNGRRQIVVRCPWCGGEHFHGAAPGHRNSHCDTPSGGIARQAEALRLGGVDVGGYLLIDPRGLLR